MKSAAFKYRPAGACIASIALLSLLALCPVSAPGQSTQTGFFGCSGRTTLFEKPGVPFATLTDAARIAKWETRPSLAFDGFKEKHYGFSKVGFYRWRISLQPGSLDADPLDQAENGDATNRLALAVRLTSAGGDRWFELGLVPMGQNYPSDDLLTIQPAQQQDDSGQPEDQPATETRQKSPKDEMAKWISIAPVAPAATLPLFVLNFEYHNTGANAEGTIGNELLLDLRGGAPQLVKAAQCIDWEGGGACTAPDTANAVYDNLSCRWEQAASDLRCLMVGAFGGDYAARAAERDFYLLSNAPARAGWQKPDTPADLAALALRLSKDPDAMAKSVMIPKLGPVALLARYRDLLPGSEVFLFASPAASPALSTHFSLVTVPDHGQPITREISKWVIAGEDTDEVAPPAGYTPFATASPALIQAGYSNQIYEDEYRVHLLEKRQGFDALQVVVHSTTASALGIKGAPGVHVLYWIGMEAVSGKLVPGAVRLASEGSTYGDCGQDLHDGSAISLRQEPGLAAANVTVRPRDADAMSPDAAPKQDQCIWNGVLHWKSGSGFRVRKLSQDCKQALPDVAITDDGAITKKSVKTAPQTRQ